MNQCRQLFSPAAASLAVLAGCLSCQPTDQRADAGDAGTVPDSGAPADAGGFDLRFRGLGTPFNLSLLQECLFTGPPPAGPEWTLVSVGPAFGYGITQGHTIWYARFRPALPIIFDSKLGGDAVTCPDSLQDLISENRVVLGLGGDVTKRGILGLDHSDARCSVLGVRIADAGTVYDQEAAVIGDLAQLSAALARDHRSRSRVVTAVTPVDGGVLYVAAGLGPGADGTFESFETEAATLSSAEIEGKASSWGESGYAVTASAWNGIDDHVLLVATRRKGSLVKYQARVYQPWDLSGSQLNPMLHAGYTPVAAVLVELPNPDGGPLPGGFMPTFLGERPVVP